MIVVLANAGTIFLVHQLSRERHAAFEAARMAERQVELHRLREDFIASVSHDLRTPLTALQAGLGMLQLSLDDRMREDEQHLLGTSRRNSERLSLLVDDLLIYNRLEMGAMRLDYDRMDLSSVLTSAISTITPLLQEMNDHIELAITTSTLYFGDARRIEQMLINLLANACEHTSAGTAIHIAIEVAKDRMLITISDDGPGVPPEDLERIFLPFHQVNASHRGSGLGLAIARRIAELHGGEVWAQNRLEEANMRGMSFFVALPIVQEEVPQCP
jgi:signal transduction histidine kinase